MRHGDLLEFERTVAANAALFKADKTYTLILRLGHNVIKTGLRKISLSYSRISLADIAAKLHLVRACALVYMCVCGWLPNVSSCDRTPCFCFVCTDVGFAHPPTTTTPNHGRTAPRRPSSCAPRPSRTG